MRRVIDKKIEATYTKPTSAWMVKLVDTLVSGTSARKGVEVSSPLPGKKDPILPIGSFFYPMAESPRADPNVSVAEESYPFHPEHTRFSQS